MAIASTQTLSNMETCSQFILREGLIAIVRGNFPAQKLIEIGDALLAAPVLVMEVTLNTTGALEGITLLRERFGDKMLVGAGTVRTAAQFDDALAAGAQFTVAPNLDLATVERAQAQDVLHLPGVFTPTEAQTAYVAGCKLVKLFPSEIVGPRYLKAIRAPLDDIQFIPTGGITPENVGDYIRAGAAAVGLGSALITGPEQPAADLIRRARAIRAAWKEAKGQ
ncbi:MAG TPA: bifunctional 4-hydroxy-2-oxoglutarate aldolase/2-dehydro-3-deoxy-phosphogluconate aldolase [Caldilineaceae bacterium]|nr:bifunctional 4-hydroxy-2-oxoglutarate aldolase/2-dehydro-3-deoxy-phosphogluconate aldolase [Caldilineaceae bacterium]